MGSRNMTVAVFFKTRTSASVRKLAPALKKAARAALGAERTKGEVNIVLMGEPGIKRLNRRFLARTGVTDVLAFNHPRPAFAPRGGVPPFGDIYICLPRARRQAKLLGHSLATELLILAAHGALHLSGMDDASSSQRRAMNKKTLRLLRKL
jgi:probable rRNA maturation factor